MERSKKACIVTHGFGWRGLLRKETECWLIYEKLEAIVRCDQFTKRK